MKILKIFLVLISLFVFLNADDDYKDFEEYKHKYYKNQKYNLYKNFDFLNLNSQQYTLLKDILIDYNEDYKELQKYKHYVKEKIEDLLKENDFNKKEFIALLKDLKYKHLEIEAYKIERIHNILDKKQRKRLAHYIEEWELD